jgi:hypothetical protein
MIYSNDELLRAYANRGIFSNHTHCLSCGTQQGEAHRLNWFTCKKSCFLCNSSEKASHEGQPCAQMQYTHGQFFTARFFMTHAGVDVTPWHNQFKYKYASVRRKHEAKHDNSTFRERAQTRRRSRSPARTPPPKRRNEQRRDDRCWLCGKNHKMADCPDSGKCLNCHMAGHKAAQCPQKSTQTTIMRGLERLQIERPQNTTPDAHGYKALCTAINEKAVVAEQLAAANRKLAELRAVNTKLQSDMEKATEQNTVLKQQLDVLREQAKHREETCSLSNLELELEQHNNVSAEQVKQEEPEEAEEAEELRPWRVQYFW